MLRWAEVGATLRGVERWLLPAECLLCQRPIGMEGDPLVCQVCRSRWPPVPPPLCERCGQPRHGDLECRICEHWPDRLGPVRSAVWLTGTARDAVHFLKYRGWWRVAEAMAPAMARLDVLQGAIVLVPVPLGASRLRERGYNQCDFLARAVAALVGAPVRRDLLQRTRDTDRQTRLTPEARRANVTGAFRARSAGAARPVLVDDVFTTGSTLVAAASALLGAGVKEVGAVTFARAARPLDDDVTSILDSKPKS